MDEFKEYEKIHKKVIDLWERYQNLIKEVLAAQGRLADLVTDTHNVGQQIYKLYQKTGNMLQDPQNERMDNESNEAGLSANQHPRQ